MTTNPNQIRGMTHKTLLPASGARVPLIIDDDLGTNYSYDIGAAFSSGVTISPLLTAISVAGSSANKMAYYTGSDTVALADFSAFGRTVVACADAAALRTVAGVVIGTNVQAYNANLVALAGLTSAADKLPYFTGSGTAAVTTFTTFGRSLVDDADAATALGTLGVSAFVQTILDDADAGTVRATIGLGTIATFPETTAAQYQANTSGKALSTDKVWSAADTVALTDASTVAVDLSTGINFSVTLGGNRTLGNPSNTTNGKTGVIYITQDGTGSRTLAYASNWKFAGGTAPVLSTTAGAVDMLFYQVKGSSFIFGTLIKDVK